MVYKSLFLATFILVSFMAQAQQVIYPTTKKIDHTDEYFGAKVADPYRWLENDRSEETAAWVAQQNKVTYNYLDQIPYRNVLKKQMEDIWNYEKIGAPFKEGSNTFYYKNNGLQNQYVLYKKMANGKDEVFLDPNTFSKDGTTSLAGISFTKNGKLVAYQISEGGSDWRKVIIMDVESKKIMEDSLTNVKFSGISWQGTKGFYYSSYDNPGEHALSAKTDQHKIYFHILGTPQSSDKLIFGNQEKIRYAGAYLTYDEKYLLISASKTTTGNALYAKDLTIPNAPMVTVMDKYDVEVGVLDHRNGKFYIETNLNAPNGKLVVVNANKPGSENWKDFIPETNMALSISDAGNYIFAKYIKDALSYIKQYDYNGKFIRDIALPAPGSAGGFSGKPTDTEIYYSFSNYVSPGVIYKFNLATGKSTFFQKPKIDFDPSQFESKQIFYASKDGTNVPMIITYKKGLKLDGTNPTILYGYGGFGVSLTPSFSLVNAIWMKNGGVYAVPNLRGGGEYGKKWHDAGTKMTKQNVFDDFIAAGEYLIAQKYTSSNYLAISGGSNGGLLVGAVMTQRPDLMKVALPAVGVLDMLRYHTFTSGAGWSYDYGTSADSPEMFNYLKGYSPLHSVKEGVKYPATMVTTGDHDDRVVPAHSFKFAAELQAKQADNNPVLIRIDVKAGHGAGKSTAATIAENSDKMAFTFWNMGILELKK